MKSTRLCLALLLLFAWPVHGQRFVRVFDSVADMVAANPNSYHTNAWLAGYRKVNDGGEGNVIYDITSAATVNLGTVFKPSGYNGRWVRPTNGPMNVLWFGAVGDGATDDLAAFNSAATTCPSGGTIYIPAGTYLLSGTWAIAKPITLKGAGAGFAETTIISPSAGFAAGADFITITGGYAAVRDICSLMNRRGGNWLTFIGEGFGISVEGNRVQGVSSNYWGIELRDPLGVNGICCSQIDNNLFYDFDGGAIWGNGGGDSVNITRNNFQLLASSSYILKWDGPIGAANLNVWANNASGAAGFIELNNSTQVKLANNQFEATTLATNTHKAMIDLKGYSTGGSIRDNNMNCHSNANIAIYLDNVQDFYIENNTISEVATNISTTTNTARISLLKGVTAGVLSDPMHAVSVLYGSGQTVLQGSLFVGSSNILASVEISSGTNQSTIIGDQRFYLGNGVFTNVTTGVGFRRQLDGLLSQGIFNYGDYAIPGFGIQSRGDIAFLNAGAITAIIKETGPVGIGTNAPNVSAVLDVTSATGGLLVPRMTKAQRDAIGTPADGLIIYQTDGTAGLHVREGGAWNKITSAADP